MMTYTQLSNTEPYLIIHADGRITVSEKLQPSETAARVLECMKTQWMEDSQSKQIRELQDRIKRLEEALTSIGEYWNCNTNERAMEDACWYAIHTAVEALQSKETKL
jgi:hypothetical protein